MTVHELGDRLVTLGRLLQNPDAELSEIVRAASLAGLQLGIDLRPAQDEEQEESGDA